MMQMDDGQILAFNRCCGPDRIVAVTGEAGTGKTTIIKNVYSELIKNGYKVAVAAPVGKAARRITEATGIEAQTLHKLLGFGLPRTKVIDGKEHNISTGPAFGVQNPLEYDIVIVDEYAMVNDQMHRWLIDAMPSGGKVRVFGDLRQLKPIRDDAMSFEGDAVADVSPFKTLLTRFNGVELTTNYRQMAGSGIAKNAQKILAGRTCENSDDFVVIHTDQPVSKVITLLRRLSTQGIDFRTQSAQIISTMKKTWIGTDKLNQSVRTHFHSVYGIPDRYTDVLIGKGVLLRLFIGEKVIYTNNQYSLGVLNGDIGTIIDIDDITGAITVDFGTWTATIPDQMESKIRDGSGTRSIIIDPRKYLRLGYVLTTHKMQGSECDVVMYVMNKHTSIMHNRSNFYTAVTRAKKMCVVVTDTLSYRKALNTVE